MGLHSNGAHAARSVLGTPQNAGPQAPDARLAEVGLHGGDVTYARMLAQIGEINPEVRRYLRSDFIADYISQYKGHAGGTVLAMHPELKEVDFLGLGCRK